MPNKFGGNKYKKGKKGGRFKPNEPIPFADEIDGCYYGQIIKRIGTGFFVTINDKQETATICGKMRNRQWCNPGDVVMVNLELDKYIITHKYNGDAVKQLKSLGKINFGNTNENDFFEDEDSNDSDNDVHNIMDSLKKAPKPEKQTKVIVVGEQKTETKSDSDSDSASLPDNKTEDPDKEKEQEKKTHKLTKQFKNKSRSDKIVAEINIAENRNNKTANANDSWIDDI